MNLPCTISSGTFHEHDTHPDMGPKDVALRMSGEHTEALLERVHLPHGGLAVCNGGKIFRAVDCVSLGIPDEYWFINAVHPLGAAILDNRGHPHYVVQQGHKQAAIRPMQVEHFQMFSLHVKGYWRKDPKTGKWDWWKEGVQFRSDVTSHGLHECVNCFFECPVSIGRQLDPGGDNQRIGCVKFTKCKFILWPRKNPGWKRIEYHDCEVAGQHVDKIVLP